MPIHRRKQRIGRRRDFCQFHVDRCRRVGRYVLILKAPLIGHRHRQVRAHAHLYCLNPGFLTERVRPIAVRAARLTVVILRAGVVDMIVHRSRSRVGVNQHAVAVMIFRKLGALLRPHDAPLRCLRVIVEGLHKRIVDRRLVVALEERTRTDHMNALDEPGRHRRGIEVVVRVVHQTRWIDILLLPHAHHALLVVDGIFIIRKWCRPGNLGYSVGSILLQKRADLVAQNRPIRHRRQRAGPQVWSSPLLRCAVCGPIHLGHMGIADALPASPLRPGCAVGRIVDTHLIDLLRVADFDPQIDVGIRRVLRGRPEVCMAKFRCRPRLMENPVGRIVVARCRFRPIIRRPPGRSNRGHIRLSPKRSNCIAVYICRCELLAILTLNKIRIFVSLEYGC